MSRPIRYIVIIGENRAEFCTPKKSDIDSKHFFVSRNQLYRCYPDEVVPCIITRYGKYIDDVEMLVYAENGIHPHLNRGRIAGMDVLKMDIDEHRGTKANDYKKAVGFLSSRTLGKLSSLIPFIIVGAILAYAFLTSGGV